MITKQQLIDGMNDTDIAEAMDDETFKKYKNYLDITPRGSMKDFLTRLYENKLHKVS